VKRFDASLSLKGLASGESRKTTIILLWAPLAIVTWRYFGSPRFFLDHLAALRPWGRVTQAAELYTYGASFLLFGLVSLLIIRLLLREPLARYGFALGDWRFGLKALLVLAPVMIVLAALASRNPDFLAQYPFDRGACGSLQAFLVHAAGYLAYYVGFETFFRGLVQFGLRDSLGDWHAILVQTALSCLVHIDKPAPEIYAAIVAGLLFGVVAFRSRSLVCILVSHFVLGISLDLFICLG
jgi:membrane protease YdiL (CAAX protease family)